MAKSRPSGAIAMSEQEFLARKGLASDFSGYSIDKTRLPHGESSRQRSKRIKETLQAGREYASQRENARQEYRDLVSSGKIRTPSKYDALLKKAKGHIDNESTLAARRSLTKRGIDWRTGKKLKGQ